MNSFAKSLATAALAAAALSLSAVAVGQPPAHNKHDRHGGYCFHIRDVSNFAATDTDTVYVRVGVSDVYRLKLFASTCLDLAWVHHMALFTRSSPFLCEGPNPDLDVGIRSFALGRQRCPVTDIKKLTPQEIAALPKGDRP